jgi:formylglycine-generating enzyme required for sulfatase activity
MSFARIAAVARRRGRTAAPFLFSVLILAVAGGCTRDEVGAAIATLAVDMRATLEPWGATTVANANTGVMATDDTLIEGVVVAPTVLLTAAPPATSDGPPTAVFSLAAAPAEATTAAPAEAGVQPSPTAPPTPTSLPTATPTPLPSPTALPPVVPVAGGSMTLVAGGFFQMGAAVDELMAACAAVSTDCRRDWFAAAEPSHPILVAPYYLDTHEVTNAAFVDFLNDIGGEAAVCRGQPCLDPDQSRVFWENGAATVTADRAQGPMAGVTWYGADAYCAWREARLPSEAEWEKAAAWDDSAMTARRYPWGDEFHGQRLNFCDATCDAPQANVAWNDGYAVAAPVAGYEDGRSATGHFDMAGNVWEWVADWFDPGYYASSPEADPTGPAAGEQKVVRGGSWYDTAVLTMSAVRFPSAPANADATLGFRCAANLP